MVTKHDVPLSAGDGGYCLFMRKRTFNARKTVPIKDKWSDLNFRKKSIIIREKYQKSVVSTTLV